MNRVKRPGLLAAVTVSLWVLSLFAGRARAQNVGDISDRWVHRVASDLAVTGQAMGLPTRGSFDLARLDGSAAGLVEHLHGTFLGTGVTTRVHVQFWDRLRVSFGASATFGEVTGLSTDRLSPGYHVEMFTGVGYQQRFGPVVVHTATMLRADYLRFRSNFSAAPLEQALASGPSSSGGGPFIVSRGDIRIGQEVGVRLNVARRFSLFGDAALDQQGAWQVGFGLIFGFDNAREPSVFDRHI